MVRLSKAEARRLGLIPPDEPEPKKAKEWGTGEQAERVTGWRKRGRPEILGVAFPFGRTHRWQRKNVHTWISFCGWEKSREGWKPSGRSEGDACPRCFKKGEE
jgi:hypothetical protein